jgi:Domain of unknown function (DUF929)
VRRFVVVLVALSVLPVSVAEAARRTDGSTPAPAQIARLVTNVPVSTLNQVGAGDIDGPASFAVFSVRGGPLTSHGKPELFSMNLAWCPHCAASSWGLAVALSRFGALTGLRVIDSGTYFCTLAANSCTLGANPCFPHTHGLSFFNTSYHSSYLSFAELALQDVLGHNLRSPTRQQTSVIASFDPQGQAPAVDVGGFGFVNSAYSPGVLAHKTWAQIASGLANPRNGIARRVDGLANLFTAAICKATKGRPAGVCQSSGVVAAGAARLLQAPAGPPGPP